MHMHKFLQNSAGFFPTFQMRSNSAYIHSKFTFTFQFNSVFNVQIRTRQFFCMNYIDRACIGTNFLKILQGSSKVPKLHRSSIVWPALPKNLAPLSIKNKHCQRHNGPMGWDHNWRHLIASKFSKHKQMVPHAFVWNSATRWRYLY